jgi:hypothetical protein
MALVAQQDMEPPVTEPALLAGKLAQLLAQGIIR